MSHLTTSANIKSDAGAPGLTGTSPGQNIGTEEVQDQSSTRQEVQHGYKAADKPTDLISSETQSNSDPKQKNSSSGSEDALDVMIEPPVRANSPTPSGAPGATGASPNQPFGDESPKHSHKLADKLADKPTDLTRSEAQSNAKPKQKDSGSDNKDTLDVVVPPPLRASSPTPSGAPGATGASPNQPFGRDESRDESPNLSDHPRPNDQFETSEKDVSSSRKISANSQASEVDRSEGKLSATGVLQTVPRAKASTKTSEFVGPNASFSSEIGSEEDPGRLAEKKIFERNAQRGDVGSMGVKQESITGGSQFEVLRSDEAA